MRDRPIVDIREPEERRCLGWIPGSRWVPFRDVTRLSDPALVVVCQSGRRSAEVVRTLGRARVHSLAGGVLGWTSAGLPLCRPESVTAPESGGPLDRRELVRLVRSCFVVEAVVTRGDDPGALDPVSTIEALFTRTGLPTSRGDFEARLDRLAEAAWHNEHGLAEIARNVERFYAMAERVTWPMAGTIIAL